MNLENNITCLCFVQNQIIWLAKLLSFGQNAREIILEFHSSPFDDPHLYCKLCVFVHQCSAQPCSRDRNSNSIDVYSFRSNFGEEGDSYTCYYNPKTPAEAFKNRGEVSTDKMTVLHCILWPLLVVLISVLSLAALFCRSYGHCCFKKRDASVPYQGLQEARAWWRFGRPRRFSWGLKCGLSGYGYKRCTR